jgi:hypothetical protein
MKLRIGRRMTVEVADLAEASRVYQRARNEAMEGYSTFPPGRVDGRYWVSYNGRVWDRDNETLISEAARLDPDEEQAHIDAALKLAAAALPRAIRRNRSLKN